MAITLIIYFVKFGGFLAGGLFGFYFLARQDKNKLATYTRELSPAQVAAYHARIFITFVENNFNARDVEAKALELIDLLQVIAEPAKIEAKVHAGEMIIPINKISEAVEVRKPGRPKKDGNA